MKHIKTFESMDSAKDEELDEKYSNIAYYLEEMQPVGTKDGFIECMWEKDPFEFSFYFKDWTEEEEYEKFYTFVEEKELKIYDEKSYKENDNYFKHEIIIRPNRKQLRKLNEETKVWITAKKYNL